MLVLLVLQFVLGCRVPTGCIVSIVVGFRIRVLLDFLCFRDFASVLPGTCSSQSGTRRQGRFNKDPRVHTHGAVCTRWGEFRNGTADRNSSVDKEKGTLVLLMIL